MRPPVNHLIARSLSGRLFAGLGRLSWLMIRPHVGYCLPRDGLLTTTEEDTVMV